MSTSARESRELRTPVSPPLRQCAAMVPSIGSSMKFLRFNLINKHGVSDHQGEVLIAPSQIESVRSFIHTDHIYSHHEVGSTVVMKTGDKHHISQHIDEVAELLKLVGEQDG